MPVVYSLVLKLLLLCCWSLAASTPHAMRYPERRFSMLQSVFMPVRPEGSAPLHYG
jgi:hypothetical protein